MEEIKKKNNKLKKIAIVLFIVIVLLGALDTFLYNEMKPIIMVDPYITKFQQIVMHNINFAEYEGIQKEFGIKELLEKVIINNEGNTIIAVTGLNYKGVTSKEQINELKATIDKDLSYEVQTYHTEELYIDQIFIREKRRSKNRRRVNIRAKSRIL